MSIDTTTSTIPSRTLELTFRAVRLPLTAVETVTRRRGADWPPATAFTRIEGALFQVAAGVLNDDALAAEGKRLQAAAIKAERATELEAEAELAEQQAEQEREERIEHAEQSQDQASERADGQRERVAESAEERRRKAAKNTKSRKQSARKREEETEHGLRRRQRNDRLAAAQEGAEALASERSALDAQAEVLDLDDAIEESRRNRKARSN